jgi:hypothetical protein
MFFSIKDIDIPIDRFGSQHIDILGHISRSVDFTLVVDGMCDLDPSFGVSVRSELYVLSASYSPAALWDTVKRREEKLTLPVLVVEVSDVFTARCLALNFR